MARIARGVGPISRDGEAALVALAIDADDRGAVVDGVGEDPRTTSPRTGCRACAPTSPGPGGIAADLEQVADDAGRTLLIATLGLVLVLLLLVYRAPVLALLPLLAVGTRLPDRDRRHLPADRGRRDRRSTPRARCCLLVLIFGAGTDYSLLLIHRYREELDRGRRPPAALPRRWPRACGRSPPRRER